MTKVEAYQCRHCGGLYISKKQMEKCRRDCASKKRISERVKEVRVEGERLANELRLTVEHITDVPDLIAETVKKLLDRDVSFTEWDVSFRRDLAATHNAPIDKPTEWTMSDKPRTKYLGWVGRCKGVTNIGEKPIEGRYNSIRGLSHVFGSFHESIIKGVHFGSGSGGRNFNYEVRMYLDDFPKIKAKYEAWLPMHEELQRIRDEERRLKELADIKFIEKSKDICDLLDVEKILRARLRQVADTQYKTIQSIQSSIEYKEALDPHIDFDYDAYYKLNEFF